MKIGFIIDDSFYKDHVGVRNIILGLSAILQFEHSVHFLYYKVNSSDEGQWYEIDPLSLTTSSSYCKDNKEIISIGTPIQLMRSSLIDKLSIQTKKENKLIIFHQQAVGSFLGKGSYDLLVVTAPWLPIEALRDIAIPTCLFVHDIIPNTNMLTKPFSDLGFAGLHRRGYVWAIQNANYLWFNSLNSQQEFLRFFPHCSVEKTRVLPPLLPQSYLALQQQSSSSAPTWEAKESALVLAAPFDIRKGLTFIPQLLESVADELETLYIYGNPRCSKSEMKQFFQTLPIKKVHWVANASSRTVHHLFAQSRGLLFPSIEEGLGLPIIEAQLMGTKVLTLDKSPMRELQLPQWKTTLGSDAAISWGKVLKDWFQTPYDSQRLQHLAITEFISPLANPQFLENYLLS